MPRHLKTCVQETVIAPFWKLEISITAFWFDAFMDSFRQGYKISESVYHTNASSATYKPKISTAFHVGEGRLNMHIYCNPNIRIGLPGITALTNK